MIESTEQTWLKLAILRGLQEGARGEEFERVVLASPHPLFDDVPADLWGEISKTRQLFTWAGDDLPADAMPLTPADIARRDLGKATSRNDAQFVTVTMAKVSAPSAHRWRVLTG